MSVWNASALDATVGFIILRTASDGSWQYVTIQRPRDDLGRYCDVFVYGRLADRTRLQRRIQAQHRQLPGRTAVRPG